MAALTVAGDVAHVTVVKGGRNAPTAVEPVGETFWVNGRGAGRVWSVPIPKQS